MMNVLLMTLAVLGLMCFSGPSHAQTDAAPVISADPLPVDDISTDLSATPPVVQPLAESNDDIVHAVPLPNEPVGDITGGAVSKVPTKIEKEIIDQIAYLNPPVNINGMPSLFFSVWEHSLIIEARRGATARPVDAPSSPGEPGLREITLSGIVYTSKKEWTIWLNKMRVTPTAIPDEVIDLKVHKDYIELDWFDAYGNKIYPIRLRPHQRFNIDAHMFLPE